MASISQPDTTIDDFGAQWSKFTDNSGYYGSLQLLQDILGPLLQVSQIAGKKIAELGSGTGRIVSMLLDAGAADVIALEPSQAFEVLKRNTSAQASRIQYLNLKGDQLPAHIQADIVISIGVLHHIPKPEPVIAAAYNALKPGGLMAVWLYGHEGNEIYLKVSGILRTLTTHMPDTLLAKLCWLFDIILDPYIILCNFLPLPMREYFASHYGKLARSKRRLTIFDQLNPGYAKYYFRQEAVNLLAQAGFKNVRTFHRHGYSWTVVGEKT